VPDSSFRQPQKSKSLNLLVKGLVTIVVLAGVKMSTATTSAYAAGEAVRITEVAAWGSGNGPYAADWFELTNVGATSLNPSSWKFDDSSYSFAAALSLNGISSIAPGESVIYLEAGAATTPAAVSAAFRTSWFASTAPAGLQIGTYTGSGAGLGTGGDAVNIFDSAGTAITGVTFGASPGMSPFASFDNAAGANGNGSAANPVISTLSVVGTNGAFLAADVTPHGIGSPGRIANATSSSTTTTVSASSTSTTSTITTTTIAALIASIWPGAQSVTAVDPLNTYSSNLSGLDYEPSGSSSPGVMWAIRNGGPNAMYRLIRNSGGQWVSDTANGWSNGKNVLFPSGTGNPDAEGITMGGYSSANGMFVSTERNNDTSATSRNAILRFDVTGSATTLTANGDWNITVDIPANGANLGLEGITWVPDTYLVASGFRNSSGALYVPSSIPTHGAGLFLVGVEGGGSIHAYALNLSDGATFTKVATFNSTLVDARGYNSVMDLQFDNETNELWAVCDDGCSGRSAVFRVSPVTGNFTRVALFDRPTGLSNINNEGFTFAPLAECAAGTRRAFWADDNNTLGNALRQGSLPCAAVSSAIPIPSPITPTTTTTVAGTITITAPSTSLVLIFPTIPQTSTTVTPTNPPTTFAPTTLPTTTVPLTTTTAAPTTTSTTTQAPPTTVPVSTTTTKKLATGRKVPICLRYSKRGVTLSNGKYVIRVYCAKFK
jgi:Lamin Tail Domain